MASTTQDTDSHVRNSIKHLGADTWLIGPVILQRSKGLSEGATWYDWVDNSSYTISDATVPPPPATPISTNDPIFTLIYQTGNCNAVWSVGPNAFCKVHQVYPGMTPEATTLTWVQAKQPDFPIPKLLYSAEAAGRSYLFVTRVPGRTLAKAWPTLDDNWKLHYVNKVANVCGILATWEGNTIGGVDCRPVRESYLLKQGDEREITSDLLLDGCKALQLDCNKLVFQHGDLGPRNIIVEDIPTLGTIGIIDWEISGFFPRDWIRTKFRISPGLDLPGDAGNNPKEFRATVQARLGEFGFRECVAAWASWWPRDPTEWAQN
ncbi:hypothetical protein BDV19DRAFT_390931 [Aspergillus venezuelensis]